MNAERLEKLAAFLDTLDPSRFDYSDWVGCGWNGTQDLVSCGTTACGLGWATVLWPEELALVATGFGGGHVVNKQNRKVGSGAACDVFDISGHDAAHLFLPENNEEENFTPQQLAEKIRTFIDEHS